MNDRKEGRAGVCRRRAWRLRPSNGPDRSRPCLRAATRIGQRHSSIRGRARFHSVDVHAVVFGGQRWLTPAACPPWGLGGGPDCPRIRDASSLNVPVVRSGPFLERLVDTPIRLVKIDIEGGEEDILREAAALFSVHSPDVVLVESNRQPQPPSGCVRCRNERVVAGCSRSPGGSAALGSAQSPRGKPASRTATTSSQCSRGGP